METKKSIGLSCAFMRRREGWKKRGGGPEGGEVWRREKKDDG